MGLEKFNPWGWVTELFAPVGKLIDDVHTSGEEEMQLENKAAEIKNRFFELQNVVASQVIAFKSELLQAQASIINTEATGKSWLQRNWRPITMLTFLVLVVCDSFGLLKFRLSNEAWTLLKIGLGGYVVGRSAEKIAPQIAEIMKK